MTVEATTNRVSYTGSGTTGPFSVPFYFLEDDDLTVIKTNNTTGVEETLTLTTDYTVSGAADPDGGSVTLVSTISSTYSLVIIRDPDRLQSTSYPRNDPFPAAAHERALDKLTMLMQRARDLFDRSFRLSDGNVASVSLEISDTAAQRANKYVGFDSDGNLTLSRSLDVGNVVISEFMETLLDDTDAAAALTTLGVSAFAQTLLDDANAAAVRMTLGLGNAATGTIGTDVQAYDADIATVAGTAAEITTGTETAVRSWAPDVLNDAILTLTGGSMPFAYIAGLKLSNNASDATNDIDIAAGAARDSTNAADIVLASGLTKQLDAGWTVGTNAGGLDTGTVANNTYHVWLIKRSDTGVVDVLFSLSATAPTMPTNYDYKRRIGSIVRAGGVIRPFIQSGNLFHWKTRMADVNTAISGTTANTRTLTLPTGIKVRADIAFGVHFAALGSTVSNYGVASDLSETDSAASASLHDVKSAGDSATYMSHQSVNKFVVTNTSAQIRTRWAAASGNEVTETLGWVDYQLSEGA